MQEKVYFQVDLFSTKFSPVLTNSFVNTDQWI